MNKSEEFDKELEVMDAICNDEDKSEDESVSASSVAEGLNTIDLHGSRFNIFEFEESKTKMSQKTLNLSLEKFPLLVPKNATRL